MGRLRRFIDRTYSPRPAVWKRPVLFGLSIMILAAVMTGGWAQTEHRWASNEIWLLLVPFGVLGSSGVLVAVFGSDYWVAVMLGRPDF